MKKFHSTLTKLLVFAALSFVPTAAFAQQSTQGETAMNMPYTPVFPVGDKNTAYQQFFTGQSYLSMLSLHPTSPIGNVTFEPKARTHWHSHKGGQILLITNGQGWYQEWQKEARPLKAGDVVEIPADVKHWHGAAKDSWFTHVSIEVDRDKGASEWMEPVSDEDYNKLP